MCGITGIKAFNEVGRINMIYLAAATSTLARRGPDHQGLYNDHTTGLGHRRLSIIDVSDSANQPMSDPSGRYRIAFNGEIFNYQLLRKQLSDKGISFSTQSDTEVLLQLYIHYGPEALNHLNGFFAFAIYDTATQELFVARDRMGIKPLYYYCDEDKFLFASEMKAILAYSVPRQLSATALHTYLQLNYVPAPLTMIERVYKLLPGHHLRVNGQGATLEKWYDIPMEENTSLLSKDYPSLQAKLKELLMSSVKSRLIADVPVGTFLSGGTDSSIIAGIASRLHPGIHSFSIGYKDDPFFDETEYAELVSKHFGTQHHVFRLGNDDLLAHLDDMVSYIDEPFADSSALPVFILSKETRKHVKVALSGDGADELFGGYYKHLAWQKSTQGSFASVAATKLLPLWKALPTSRSSYFGNKTRQLVKLGDGMKLTHAERYWRWAGFMTDAESMDYLADRIRSGVVQKEYLRHKSAWTAPLKESSSLNHFLLADCRLVLPDDMLAKVDRMSMAHGLEVRVPFLDYRIVAFAFSLHEEFKIQGNSRKRILQDTFREFLPSKLYNRPKKGFEVPLLRWMKHELTGQLDEVVFNTGKLSNQAIFDSSEVMKLRAKLHSNNPGDAHATTWALYVFQKWWNKYFAQ